MLAHVRAIKSYWVTESHLAYNLIYSILPFLLIWVISHSLLSNLLPTTVSLAFLMSAATCTKSTFRSLSSPISNRVLGYPFTLSVQKSRSSPSWFLKCPPHVAQFFCYFMKTFQFCCPPLPRGALPIVEYTGRLRPKGGTFLSLQHSERLEKSYVRYVKGHQSALLSKRDSS